MLEIYCRETQTIQSRSVDLFVLAIICRDYRDFIAFFAARFLVRTIIFRKTTVFIAFPYFLISKKQRKAIKKRIWPKIIARDRSACLWKAEEGNKIPHPAENYCPRPINLLTVCGGSNNLRLISSFRDFTKVQGQQVHEFSAVASAEGV